MTKLVKPTVRDVIRYLQTLPIDTPFRIDDADTGWTISTIYFEENKDGVFLSGKYEEMEG